jgi:hypothetical protein
LNPYGVAFVPPQFPAPKQPSELVEFTKEGEFVRQISIDPVLDGDFGIGVATSGGVAHFAAGDDNQNILLIWTFKVSDNDCERR